SPGPSGRVLGPDRGGADRPGLPAFQPSPEGPGDASGGARPPPLPRRRGGAGLAELSLAYPRLGRPYPRTAPSRLGGQPPPDAPALPGRGRPRRPRASPPRTRTTARRVTDDPVPGP